MSFNKTYSKVQMNINFEKEVSDGVQRLPDKILYSNIAKNSNELIPGEQTRNPNNLAVTLAKIYTWANDMYDFSPSAIANKIKIKAGSLDIVDANGKIKEQYLPSYVDDVIEGYYSEYAIVTTEPVSFDPTCYYKYDSTTQSYVLGSVGDVWADDTWYTDTGAFYDSASTHTTATKLPDESGKIYVDLESNDSYRWGGTTYVKISNPTDVFTGATAVAPGTVGLVPAPPANAQGKFLRGDATWQDVPIYTHPTYTQYTGKPTSNQTPSFGDTFYVSQVISDNLGHVSQMNDRTIKIPDTVYSGASLTLLTSQPASFDPTNYFKADGINYISGEVGDAWAADTWYSGTNGGKGLVPSPTPTDVTKYLKGDGTWSNPLDDINTLILNCTYDETVT